MRRLIHIGCSLAAVGLLGIVLACGAGAAIVQQRAVAPPRLNVQVAGYRVVASPVTIRSKPPKYYYSVWFFVTSYPSGSKLRTEKGEQILLLPLRAD
jgi:hypothetical protein